jgi:penicillin-binding protein A
MTRRQAALLVGAAVRAWSGPRKNIDQLVGDIPGAALLVDVRTRALLAVHRADLAGALLVPPGSAIKPFTIEALLRGGKLKDGETLLCPGALTIGGRSFNCSHPAVATPIDARTALAYSCNCFVAHFAARFTHAELAAHLIRCGLSSRSGFFGDGEATGRVERATAREAQQLQAIGEGSVLVTPVGMALAYRRLALSAPDAIRRGLEGAVEFGTAQHARASGTSVAGKTGCVRAEGGAMHAWFCGFAPSKAPSVVVAVMLEGRSGGADAAPVASRIVEAHFAGQL